MKAPNLKQAGILALMIVVIVIGCWELYLRSIGISNSFDDNEPLWAYKRAEIYDRPENSTFFIGSSRIKFDIDLKTWEDETGEKPVQLALVGTSPQLILKDLANDKNFKGKLIVDATEFVLFTRDSGDQENAKKSIAYFKKRTPDQIASFYVDYVLQSGFVFLESKQFSLNTLLNKLPAGKRKGVDAAFSGFPIGFEPSSFDRQNIMSQDFLNDTGRQIIMKNNWRKFGLLDTTAGIRGDSLQNVFKDVKSSINKIQARGGVVIFIRPPSSGEMREAEKKAYPRNIYWDGLLAYTNNSGIHFEDYPEMTHFICPEWSHLSPKDAATFTKSLIKILEQKGWFLHKQTTAFNNIN